MGSRLGPRKQRGGILTTLASEKDKENPGTTHFYHFGRRCIFGAVTREMGSSRNGEGNFSNLSSALSDPLRLASQKTATSSHNLKFERSAWPVSDNRIKAITSERAYNYRLLQCTSKRRWQICDCNNQLKKNICD